MRAMLCDGPDGVVVLGGRELVDRWRVEPSTTIWVDFEHVTDEERDAVMRDAFGIHPLAIQDALRPRHPPKVERFDDVQRFDDVLFLMLRGLDAETTDIDFGYIGISLFVGARFLVTRHTGPSPSTDWLWQQARDEPAATADTAALAVRLADRVVRRYLPVLLSIEPRLEALEEEIFANPDDEQLAELTGYKTRLKQLRRIFIYHAQAIADLQRMEGLDLAARFSHELVDVADQVGRSASLAELYYELASDLVDAYLATSAHRLNRVMQVLTIITVIFVPLSFLAGIYGMNFENMPELSSRSGYFILLTLMGCVVAVQLVLFRKKRWL